MATPVSAVYFPTPTETPLHPESAHMRQLLQQGQNVSEIATTLAVPESEVLIALGLAGTTTPAPAPLPVEATQSVPGTASSPTSLSVTA